MPIDIADRSQVDDAVSQTRKSELFKHFNHTTVKCFPIYSLTHINSKQITYTRNHRQESPSASLAELKQIHVCCILTFLTQLCILNTI